MFSYYKFWQNLKIGHSFIKLFFLKSDLLTIIVHKLAPTLLYINWIFKLIIKDIYMHSNRLVKMTFRKMFLNIYSQKKLNV